ARFKAAIRETVITFIPTHLELGFVEYTTTNGDRMWFPLYDSSGTCRYSCACNPLQEKLPTLNGQLVDWDSYPLFASPYVNSDWDSGFVQVVFNDRKLTLDFRDPDNPIKTEGSLHPPTPTPTVTVTPTETPTTTPTATLTNTAAPTVTGTPSQVPSSTPTLLHTLTASATLPDTPTSSATLTPTPTYTASPTHTPTHGSPATPTASATSTASPSPTPPPGGGESWLVRLLQRILEWLRRLWRSLQESLQSLYGQVSAPLYGVTQSTAHPGVLVRRDL
ncbi:MAG: hypothetical protein JSW37_02675, partial [Anaerolineales bacterium]